jgi:3-phenylpropionate/trans-cinnamate dioxygenase ferredoxin reductase subunit
MQRIVVVGNGIAGLTAADALRAEGFDGQLTIVGQEVHAPYSRPALSKSALHEEGDVTAHLLPEPEHGAEEILGVSVIGIDVDAHVLQLDNGTSLEFDGLIIASGIRPRKIREDLDLEMTFRNFEDALRLRESLKSTPRVIVVGAGVLGMEIASSCIAAGSDVTVVSRRTPLLAFMGEYLANLFTGAAREKGVKFVSPAAVDVRSQADVTEVILEDGQVLGADLVITTIGDQPNTEWLVDSGLMTNGELEVDTRGRLRPHIVAAGDVAAIATVHGNKRVPLWTSAIEQAKVAAKTLLHGDDAPELDFQHYFWTDQFGLSLKACGNFPVVGEPGYVEGTPGEEPSLLRWENADGTGTAVSLNYRIPVPKLRALSRQAPA